MKKLLLSLLISFFSFQGIAQDPDPDLFQTWYLQDIFLEFGPPLELIEPPIYPYLTILETLDYSGQAACNTFTGTYMYDPLNDTMQTIEFNNTNDDCVFPYHNGFEPQYYQTISEWSWYNISEDGIGLQLEINHVFGASATFTNYPLSISDFALNEIKVYPNPSSSRIFIKSPGDPVTKIELYSLLGQNIQTLNDNVESIDISGLVSGIYLLKISTEVGAVIKKIIKL